MYKVTVINEYAGGRHSGIVHGDTAQTCMQFFFSLCMSRITT